jgi:cysteine-rich repeat protein
MRSLFGGLALFGFSALLGGTIVPFPVSAGTTCLCGDGFLCGPELCDDGNTIPDDACSFPSCLPRVCGDGITNPDPGTDEECDDSNTVDDDGCTAGTTPNCQFDCGDGEVDPVATPPEFCDDGNETNGDACDDDPSAASPGNCSHTECGNGVVTPPEECDPPSVGTCEENCIQIDGLTTKGQQKCINAVNKNLAGVAKAQGADNAKCVKDVAGAKTPSIDDCLGDDVDGKVAKAREKTTKTVTGSKCSGENLPALAFTDAPTVNGTTSEMQEAVTEVFGATPAIGLESADNDGAGCQGEVLKQLNAVNGKWLAAANKAKKTALKGGKGGRPPPPAMTNSEIAKAIDTAVAASTALAKAESKANTSIAKKCQDDAAVDALFDCGGATTVNGVTLCVIAAAKEAACNALEVADGLSLTCPSDIP